jgi:hypothetical protein
LQVDALVQGRVWTGSEALKIGLVDKIGGLDDAIAKAASLAKKLQYSKLSEYEKNFNDLLANFPFAKSKADFIKEEIRKLPYSTRDKITNSKRCSTIMPFETYIKISTIKHPLKHLLERIFLQNTIVLYSLELRVRVSNHKRFIQNFFYTLYIKKIMLKKIFKIIEFLFFF